MTSTMPTTPPDPAMLPDADVIVAYARMRTAVMMAHHQSDKVDAQTRAALRRTAVSLEARMGARARYHLNVLIDATAA
jgi:hypothetical protein